MYQPRRVLEPIESGAPATPRPSDPGRPRRAATSWRDQVGQRTGIGLGTLAAVATGGAIVLSGGSNPAQLSAPSAALAAEPPQRDAIGTSRSQARPVLQLVSLTTSTLAEDTEDLVALTPLYTTGQLNLRASTGRSGPMLWLLATHLADETADLAEGITMAPCPRGSAVENKLRADTIKIYRSVCALFPDVNSYGGWRPGGRQFHKNGRALDIMLTPKKESALGWRIAKYLIANAKAFNIDHVIFEQQIGTPGTPRWRHMADRGSITASHFNHVHVAIKA